MASAWQKDRPNARGQLRSTVYFRDRDTGETVTDGTYPKKIAAERVRALLTRLDDPGFNNPKQGREPFRVFAEKWFAARPGDGLDTEDPPIPRLPAAAGPRRRTAGPHRPIPRPGVDRGTGRPGRPRRQDLGARDDPLLVLDAVDDHEVVRVVPINLREPHWYKGTVNLSGKGVDVRVFLTLDQLEEFLATVAAQMPYWSR